VVVGGGRAVALGDGEGREEGGEILIRYGGGDGGGIALVAWLLRPLDLGGRRRQLQSPFAPIHPLFLPLVGI
jgi:hypothetical protein